MLNNYHRNDELNNETSKFIEESFANDTINELRNRVMQTEIKNALKTSFSRVPNFNLKICAFVYDWLVYFPKSDIQYETFITNSFFVNAHHLIKLKVHLHHSHITGKIIGYDFCNARVKENNVEMLIIAHNQFSFDLNYFIKTYIASAWCSKELKIRGNNLTHINFSNIAGEIKFIVSLKYYQKSLAELARTLSEEGKAAVKNSQSNFLTNIIILVMFGLFLILKKRKKFWKLFRKGKG